MALRIIYHHNVPTKFKGCDSEWWTSKL